jgi:hypothetical protein
MDTTRHFNPYKGLFSYAETDSNLFYGRDPEKRKLLRLVKHNFLTVVFGKSGIGKTSLLRAGLFPLLRQNGFLPITLSMNYEEPDLTNHARHTILEQLKNNNIREMEGDREVRGFHQDETLWEYFHRVKHVNLANGKVVTPVLVLDQFEEMFTLGKRHPGLGKWLDELYYLIENELPDSLRKRILEDDREMPFPYAGEPPPLRVIAALREDYLPHLNTLKTRMPSIDRVKFRLLHLDGNRAREVINMPGGIRDAAVTREITRIFYPQGAIPGEDIPGEKLEVEPSLLSLVCFQIVEEGKGQSFSAADRDRILTRFYDAEIKNIPAKVEKFVESHLLTEGGFKTFYRLEKNHPLETHILDLVQRRVLRKVHWGEKEYIEIIHDVLAPIIKEKRSRRTRKSKNGIIAMLAALVLVFAGLTLYALSQYKRVQVLQVTGEAFLELPKDNTRALRIARAGYELGLPDPPSRTRQALAAAGYSSFEEPFYIQTLEHQGPVNSAVFSPDGKRILTASSDGTAKLWDAGGKLLADLNKHKGAVLSAVFSPDGKRILTASSDGTAKVWYTPEAIYEWLKSSPIPPLTDAEKEELGIK